MSLDLKNWKQYLDDITTDSLWISSDKKAKNDCKFVIPKRDFLPKNDPSFHGLFIPEIPYQFIKRFTNDNDIIWDCFGGSGTTKRVADILNRKCIINDINPKHDFVQRGDSRYFDPGEIVQLIFMHPPYHSIVKYSNTEGDGSNFKNLNEFINWFDQVCLNVTKHLEKNKHLILVCGNIYLKGEEITLGVMLKDIIRNYGFILKSHIIKDYGETKNKGNKYNLNYYRQLKGGFNNFYGDNIFVMKKIK